jgi:hypothetical protein
LTIRCLDFGLTRTLREMTALNDMILF